MYDLVSVYYIHCPYHLLQVPLNIDIREGADAGRPIVDAKPDSESARAYADVAKAIWHQVQERSKQ